MKAVNMKKQDIKQFYVLPTFIIARNYLGRRYFLVWLWWSLELKAKPK